jgi:hypothetical protein
LTNLLPWEQIDKQLNASALHLIHMSLTEKDKAFIRNITSTKEAWDVMTHKYRGSQQSSREVKLKFIDSIQGEPKNIYKP